MVETNIIDVKKKKKIVHTTTSLVVKEKVKEINIHSSVKKRVDDQHPKTLIKLREAIV